MGDAEGLVQVEVADIGTEGTRTAQPHLGIEVGPIEVHLAPVPMHHRADLTDAGFKHAVGGGVGDHQRRQPVGVLGRLRRQILLIDVALVITGDSHHLEAGHHGTGGVGAMGAGGDQTDVAMGFTAGAVPGANHQQPGVFPLGTGIGLQRHGGKARQGGQPLLEIVGQTAIALGLIGWGKGMQGRKRRPAHRLQLGGGVELHGATAQRDHPVHQRQITAHQTLDVAQQL